MKPKPDKLMPALYGGLVTAGLWAIPGLNFINCCCCAGILLGGFIAVLFYRQSITPEMDQLTLNDCVRVGILSGVIASIAAVVIQGIVMMVFGNIAIEMMERIVERMNVEFPAEFQRLIDQAKHERISLVGSILSIFLYLIPNTLFSVLGALIGWSVFKPKTPVQSL